MDPLTDKEMSFSKTEREGPTEKRCEDDPVCARMMARNAKDSSESNYESMEYIVEADTVTN